MKFRMKGKDNSRRSHFENLNIERNDISKRSKRLQGGGINKYGRYGQLKSSMNNLNDLSLGEWQSLGDRTLEIYKKLSRKLREDSVSDNSGLYKIIKAKELQIQKFHDVSIVSQCSSNHLSHVEELFTAWEGPISIAVYSDIQNLEITLWNIARFLHCHKNRIFGMQLVFPQGGNVWNNNFGYSMLSDTDKSVSCSSPYISVLNEKGNYNWTFPYPVNLLRNVAKSEARTNYILVIDIDMLPSPNLREGFLNFTKVSRSPVKAVYVVPVFEALPDVEIPPDKKALLDKIELNLIRPFYVVPCENCQKLTKYDEWLECDYSPGIRVVYQVPWKHPWEPFFIATRDVPNFDERFKQYGMNRVSQICEIYVAGFKFRVLDNAFLIHKGYKLEEDFHPTKMAEMEANRRVYAQFKVEVKYKYQTKRSC